MRGVGRSIDIPPTILELAGVKAEEMDGSSMLDYFERGIFPARDRYAETPIGGGALSMVRKDGYKLLSVGPATREDGSEAPGSFYDHKLAVFDLNTDPYEYVNIINSEQGREVLEWAIQTHAELKTR
jgi:arylsulfatase A-like enzyme